MQKCERCQVNDARVRLDSIANGRREQHYFCQQCAEEMLGGSRASYACTAQHRLSGEGANVSGASRGVSRVDAHSNLVDESLSRRGGG